MMGRRPSLLILASLFNGFVNGFAPTSAPRRGGVPLVRRNGLGDFFSEMGQAIDDFVVGLHLYSTAESN
jgi:hypothetical protein